MSTEHQTNPAPAAGVSEECAFPKLAIALRAQVNPIASDWEMAVLQILPTADRLTLGQLREHLPIVLGQLADALSSFKPESLERLLHEPAEHAVTRFHQDYSVRELIIEYRLLRRIVVEKAEVFLQRRLTREEDLTLDMGIDSMLQQSVVSFVEYQKTQLRTTAEAESKFLSFMAHDLRNNLHSIMLGLEVLRHRLADMPDFAEDVADVDSAKHSIMETIAGMERLLQAERLRKAPQIKTGPVDLHAAAVEVAKHFSYQAQRSGVTVSVEVPPDTIIRSDREWIMLVLQNLVSNATKYSMKGEVRIRFEQQREDGQQTVAIAVADEGPGIPPEQVQEIFQAFRRGETYGRAGVGLGLAIASQAARLLGGELAVESQVGVGSTFRLILPQTSPSSMAT